MVNQNYILYVNEKKQLRESSIDLQQLPNGFANVNFKISEKHLICGLIINGMPIKGDKLKNFPFTAIEKYLFEFTNVHFIIPENQYQQPKDYSLKVEFDFDFIPFEIDVVGINNYDKFIMLKSSYNANFDLELFFNERTDSRFIGNYSIPNNYDLDALKIDLTAHSDIDLSEQDIVFAFYNARLEKYWYVSNGYEGEEFPNSGGGGGA